jgi:hypothetical protein
MFHSRNIGRALVVLALACTSALAMAKTSICVEVLGDKLEDKAPFQAFAMSEVRRHTEYIPVESECERTLHLEHIDMDGQRYWTGYLDGQVPARYAITQKQNSQATLSRVITAVLKSDPAGLLEDTGQFLNVALRSDIGLQRGVMLYGFEGFQTLTMVGTDANFLPGIGLRIRRGIENFYVGIRAGTSFGPLNNVGAETDLTLVTTFEPEAGWIANDDKNTSFYVGGSVGLTIIRFERNQPERGKESDTRVGLSFGARAGVEFLRHLDYRMDAFVQLNLPVFFTETNLVEGYTPSAHLGLGVAF